MSAVSRRLLLRASGVSVGAAALSAAAPAAARAEEAPLIAGTTPPSPLGGASAGSATEGARVDHVHPATGLVPLASPAAFVLGNRWSSKDAAAVVLSARAADDAAARLAVHAGGGLAWGAGGAPADTSLFRPGTRALRLQGRLTFQTGGLVLDTRPAPNLRRRSLRFAHRGISRWALDTDSVTENGANRGSVFGLNTYADNGSYLRNAFAVRRDTGDVVALPGRSDPRCRLVVGDDAPGPAKLHVRSDLPTALLATVQQSGSALGNAMVLQAATAGTVAHSDGFGARLVLGAGPSGAATPLGAAGSARRGADNSHDLTLTVARDGGLVTPVRVTPQGSVLVGAAATQADGARVLALADAEVLPVQPTSGAGVLFSSAGALCFLGPTGTTTVLAPA